MRRAERHVLMSGSDEKSEESVEEGEHIGSCGEGTEWDEDELRGVEGTEC